MLTWKVIFGAAGFTGLIAPMTLQYSGIASTARLPCIFCGAAAMSSAEVMLAPVVGSPMALASMVSPCRDWQDALLCANGSDAAASGTATVRIESMVFQV